jgi:hypothetical protein
MKTLLEEVSSAEKLDSFWLPHLLNTNTKIRLALAVRQTQLKTRKSARKPRRHSVTLYAVLDDSLDC